MSHRVFAFCLLVMLSAVAQGATTQAMAEAEALTKAKEKNVYLYLSRVPLDKEPDKRLEGDAITYKKTRLAYYCTSGFKEIVPNGSPVPPCTEPRVEKASRGAQVVVAYVEPVAKDGQCIATEDVQFNLEEVARKTQLELDLRAVVKFIARKDAAAVAAASTSPAVCESIRAEYTLQHIRASAKVTATTKVGDGESVDKSLITGPGEHWFLSGDAVIKGAKELKYDPDSKQVLQRDKPEQLYLGINYMIGDLYTKHPKWDTDRIVGKLMILPSRRPFDSVGIGIGYRFADGVLPNAPESDKPSGGFMVFVGTFWTKGEKVDAGGAVVPAKRERSWRIGVSYSLENLFGWLQ